MENTSLEVIEKIKFLLFELIDLLEKNRIHYWLDSGTLLGCLRDGKIIPWDDDADLSCFIKDQDAVKKLLQQNEVKNGRFLENRNTHYHYFFSKQDTTHVDVFFYREIIPGIMVFEKDRCLHIYKDYLLPPLPQKEFYQRLVNIPRNAENFLIRRYGPDCLIKYHKYKSGNGGKYKENLPEVYNQEYKDNRFLFLSLTSDKGKLCWDKPFERSNQIFAFKNNQIWSKLDRMGITSKNDQLMLTSHHRNNLTWKIIKHQNNLISLQETKTEKYLGCDLGLDIKLVDQLEDAAKIKLNQMNGGVSINYIKEIYPAKGRPEITVFLLGGGCGSRFNDQLPKQFHILDQNQPILYYSLKTLNQIKMIQKIILVIPKEYQKMTEKLLEEWGMDSKVELAWSGAERSDSIMNAYNCYLNCVVKSDYVIITDVARPLVSIDDYLSLIEHVKFYGIVGFKIETKLNDSVPHSICTETGMLVKYLPRVTSLCQVHCPMIIDQALLVKYVSKLIEVDFNYGFYQKLIGISPKLIDGDVDRLLKITYPNDLTIAQKYLDRLR